MVKFVLLTIFSVLLVIDIQSSDSFIKIQQKNAPTKKSIHSDIRQRNASVTKSIHTDQEPKEASSTKSNQTTEIRSFDVVNSSSSKKKPSFIALAIFIVISLTITFVGLLLYMIAKKRSKRRIPGRPLGMMSTNQKMKVNNATDSLNSYSFGTISDSMLKSDNTLTTSQHKAEEKKKHKPFNRQVAISKSPDVSSKNRRKLTENESSRSVK